MVLRTLRHTQPCRSLLVGCAFLVFVFVTPWGRYEGQAQGSGCKGPFASKKVPLLPILSNDAENSSVSELLGIKVSQGAKNHTPSPSISLGAPSVEKTGDRIEPGGAPTQPLEQPNNRSRPPSSDRNPLAHQKSPIHPLSACVTCDNKNNKNNWRCDCLRTTYK